MRYVVVIAIAGILAGNIPQAAEAARPKNGATYRGKTSQGRTMEVSVSRRGRVDAIADVRTQCRTLGRSTSIAVAVMMRVRTGGRFGERSIDVEQLDVTLSPIVLDGRRRSLFDVSKTTLSGIFTTRRRASGTWRVQSLIFDRGTFTADKQSFDECDTGVIGWNARLRR